MLVQFNSEESRSNYRSLWNQFLNKVLNIGILNTTSKTIAGAINELEENKLDDVVAGINVTIDKTDPKNPIINSSGGGVSEILDIPTSETNASLVLAPDGIGGVEFRAESGGGAATSVTQGTAYTTLGTLLNDSFPGTTLNATNWSGSLPTGASINDKLIIASGSATWDRYITLVKHYLYEKLTIQVDVTAVTKASGDAWGWGFNQITAYTNTYVYWKFDQYTGILSAGTNTTATNLGSMQPIEFSAGDDLRFIWKRTPTRTYVTIENLTDSTAPKVLGEWNLCKWGSGNNYRLTFLGGQQEFTLVKIDSTVRNYVDNSDGIVVIGDSIGNGYGLTNRNDRVFDLIMKGQTHKYENLCIDSWGTDEYTTARLTEFLTNINGKYLIINLGYNDATRGVALATFQTNLENLATTAQGLGFEVIFVSIWPHISDDKSSYNTYMGNAATSVGAKFINNWDDLTNSNLGKKEYYFDGSHPNKWGASDWADLIHLADGEFSDLILTGFNNTDIQLREVGYSSELSAICIFDADGNVKRTDPKNFVNKNSIELQQGVDSDGYSYYTQTGNMRITGMIQNNAPYIQKADSTGLKIGFSNDVNDTLGSNINITNKQNASGRQQLFSNISGARNLLIQGLTVKSGYSHNISGDDNVIIMSQGFTTISGDNNICINTGTTLGSGSNNILMGVQASTGIITGNRNIHISSIKTGVSNFPSSLSDTIIIGEMGYGEYYVANDVGISTGLYNDLNVYLGGKRSLGTNTYMISVSTPVDNTAGNNFLIRAGLGRNAGEPGLIKIQHSEPNSGNPHATINDTMVFNYLKVTSEVVFRLGRYTATEASALTPADADMIYITDTDATFTSVGFWGYENGAWVKL